MTVRAPADHAQILVTSPDGRWLLLAEHLAATPSAFKASEIRTIVRAVIEIADSGYDEHDAIPGGAA